jgi:hypothetical protein
MPNHRVALLTNPASTRNLKNINRMRRVVAAGSNILHLELDGIESMAEALRQIARYDPVVLIISGGDGTVQAVVTSLNQENPFDELPPLAVLPSGKTNLVAADLGMHGRPESLFNDVVAIARGSKFRKTFVKRPLMRLDLGEGKPQHYGFFLGGAGAVNAIEFCRRRLFPLRLPNFLTHILAILLITYSAIVGGRRKSSPTYSRKVSINALGGGRLEGHFLVFIATSLDHLFLGIHSAKWAGKGGIGLIAVEHNRQAVMRALRAIITGRIGTTTIAGVHVRRINEIRVSGRDPILLDGEIFEAPVGRPLSLKAVNPAIFVSLRGYK